MTATATPIATDAFSAALGENRGLGLTPMTDALAVAGTDPLTPFLGVCMIGEDAQRLLARLSERENQSFSAEVVSTKGAWKVFACGINGFGNGVCWSLNFPEGRFSGHEFVNHEGILSVKLLSLS
jgi:hypothetical protein